MRRYETIVILDPDLSEENRTAFNERIKEIMSKFEGVLLKEDVWGNRKLAYEVKKKPRGFYIRYDYCGMGALVDELERSFRIDDRVMRYLTVILDKDADVESLLSEMQSSESGKTTQEVPAGSEKTAQTEKAQPEQPANEAADEQTASEPEPEAEVQVAEKAPASDTETSKEDE